MNKMRLRTLATVSLVLSLISVFYALRPGNVSWQPDTSAVSATTTTQETASPSTAYTQDGNGLNLPASDDDFAVWEKACSSNNQTVPDQCLVSSLASVLEKNGPEATVAAFKKALEIPRIKVACHTPSHRLGGLLYNNLRDIKKALDVVDGSCELGVIHGVFETWGETVDLEYVKSVIPALCAEATAKDTTFPPRKCAHGAGHAIWPASDGDLKAALSVCDTLGDEFTVSECGGGVTMSMLMGVGAGEPVTQDSVSDVAELCNSYSINHKMSCITETGPMSLRLARMDVAKAVKLCYELEGLMDKGTEFEVSYHCTSAVGYSAPQQAAEDPDKIVQLCSNADSERLVGACLYGAVKQMRLRGLPTVKSDLDRLCAVVPKYYSADCKKAAVETMDY
jgi:hypothetical protein